MANLGRLALCILLASYISSCGKPAKRRSSGTPQASVVDTNLVEAGTAQPVKDVLTPSSPSEFRDIIEGSRVVFVYFWASWCDESLAYTGIAQRVLAEMSKNSDLEGYEIIAAEYDKVLNDFKIEDEAEAEKANQIKQELGIIGTPNMFFFIDGVPVKYSYASNEADKIAEELRSMSMAGKEQVSSWTEDFLLKAERRNKKAEEDQ